MQTYQIKDGLHVACLPTPMSGQLFSIMNDWCMEHIEGGLAARRAALNTGAARWSASWYEQKFYFSHEGDLLMFTLRFDRSKE